MQSRLHNLTGDSVTLSASFTGGSWVTVELSAGQLVYFDSAVEFSKDSQTVLGGQFADVYALPVGFAVSGELPDFFAIFWQGFGFGCILAGAVLTLWIVKLMRRGVVEG